MARLVWFGVPAHGHVNPTLPVVRALVDAGHSVVYYAGPAFDDALAAAGASPRAYPSPPGGAVRVDPDRPDPNALRLGAALQAAAVGLLPELLREVGREAFDAAVHDSLCPWGRYTSSVLGLPAACSVSTFAFGEGAAGQVGTATAVRTLAGALRAVPRAVRASATLRRRYGVRDTGPLGALTNRAATNVVFTSRAFQPDGERYGAATHFVGPTLPHALPPRDASFPWAEVVGQSVAYVSLGTLRNDRPGFYRACAAGLAGLTERLVLSTGRVDPASLGVSPDVLAFARVPQVPLLAEAAVFVTHGGMNSVHEGLWMGVPLVVCPQTEEQEIVARRVAAVGAGVALGASPSADALRAAASRVLGEPAFAAAARRVGATLREAGGAPRAAAVIGALVLRGSGTGANARIHTATEEGRPGTDQRKP